MKPQTLFWGSVFSAALWAIIAFGVLSVTAHCQDSTLRFCGSHGKPVSCETGLPLVPPPRWQARPWALLDSEALYHGSQAFVISTGGWDAVDTARGVRLYGEAGLTGKIVGKYNAGGNAALLVGVDGLTLLVSHELANHNHRRWGTVLNIAKGGFSVGGASTWIGLPLGNHTRIGIPAPVPRRK